MIVYAAILLAVIAAVIYYMKVMKKDPADDVE